MDIQLLLTSHSYRKTVIYAILFNFALKEFTFRYSLCSNSSLIIGNINIKPARTSRYRVADEVTPRLTLSEQVVGSSCGTGVFSDY